jgi:hypothetical protein
MGGSMRMSKKIKVLSACSGVVLLGLFASNTMRAAEPLLALGKIEPGLWDVRSQDQRDGGRTMCVRDPAIFLQLAHPNLDCSRFPIENQARTLTVHYSCAGAGNGQTDIRLETPRLVQIHTQGIAHNAPFFMSFEARHIGSCAPQRK